MKRDTFRTNTIIQKYEIADRDYLEIIKQNEPEQKNLFENEKKQFRCKSIRKFQENIFYQVFITLLTIIALFIQNIRVIWLDKNTDIFLDILEIGIMIIFFIEIFLSSLAYQNYIFSFLFFLDIISTISILLDIELLTNLLFGIIANNNSIAAYQAKASMTTIRAIKILKLVRVIRIAKLYKTAVKASEIRQQLKKQQINRIKLFYLKNIHKYKNETNQCQIVNSPEQMKLQIQKQQQLIQESKLSVILIDATIKKVIFISFFIIFIVPIFENHNYIEDLKILDLFQCNLNKLLQNPNINMKDIIGFTNSIIKDHLDQNTPLLYFITPFNQIPQYTFNISGFRVQDLSISILHINVQKIHSIRPELTINQVSNNSIIGVLNIHLLNVYAAYFQIGKTFFICTVICILLHFFIIDINLLIISPIQYMMQKIKTMAQNPTSVAVELVEQSQYQTAIIHNAIVKIGKLLSLVFGNAGAQIIGSNISRQGSVNVLTGGKKKCAIFGFCNIRNFLDANEVLQQDIIIFVNQIAELIHSSLYRYGGSPNQNIGDSFLLVWKIPQNKYKISKSNQISWLDPIYINILADFTLLALVKAVVKINKQPSLLQYRKDQRLLQRLGASYQITIGLGLHIGWAIEGPIGSEHKIDASYLSPNVHIATKLANATKQYGVEILMSDQLYSLLTQNMQTYCRQIDRIILNKNKSLMKIFTIDLDIANISPPKTKTKKPFKILKQNENIIQNKKRKNIIFLDQKRNQYDAHKFISEKKEFREVLKTEKYSKFRRQFKEAYENYINGRWEIAQKKLKDLLKIKKQDGPANRLLKQLKKQRMDIQDQQKLKELFK